MAASTYPQTQTIAEQPSGSSGREFDTLQLLNGSEDDWMPYLGDTSPSSDRKDDFSLEPETKCLDFPAEADKDDGKVKDCLECEVCGAVFETRRGLSSHARYHLRQLGVTLSDSSGAPIDLLYQLAKEGALDESLLRSPSGPPPAKKHHHQSAKSRKGVGPKARCKAAADDGKGASLPGRSVSPSPLVRSRSASPVLRSAPVSSLLPASSPLRSSEPKGTAARTVPSSHRGGAKPLWAPQDTDAPLNLALDADPTKDIVCELCGAWFETRKGLASHARAHLRHLGVLDADSKGSPIDGLHQLIRSEDFRRRLASLDPKEAAELCLAPSSSSSKTTKRSLSRVSSPGGSKGTSSMLSPSLGKKPKASAAQQGFGLSGKELGPRSGGESDLVKEVECEFCGEFFENRKGLSSHARSHLRQMGVTEWTVNGSPYNTLMEVVARRGLSCAVPPRTVTSPRLSPGPPVLSPPASPSSPGALKRLTSTLDSPRGRQPTARKACRPKMENPSLELSGRALERAPLQHSWPDEEEAAKPLQLVSAVKAQEPDPLQEVQCEFCGESFENRKGLSSHARSHLRQMGVTEWTVNGSPIDTLVDVVRKKGLPNEGRVKEEPPSSWEELDQQSSQLPGKSPPGLVQSSPKVHKYSFSLPQSSGKGADAMGASLLGKKSSPRESRPEEKMSSQLKTFSSPSKDSLTASKSAVEKPSSGHVDASCELCGFCFENRKALASHARAHLRQFGVTEWRVNGSPIETLHAWIRKEPRRVAEMQRRWAQGGPPRPKKKSSSFLVSLSHPGGSLARSQKPLSSGASGHRVGREVAGGVAGSSRSADGRFHGRPSLQHGHGNRVAARRGDTLLQSQAAHSQLNVRSPRGFERRPPKHLVSSEGREQESGSSQAPRTGTVPALVPKPPSTPLVKVVGDVYSLRCRFCEVEFRGPLSVQEDWVRHLQRHILGLNFNKRDPPAPPPRADAAIAPASAIAAEAPAPGPASGPSPGPAPGPPLPPASPLAPSPTLAAAPVSVPASVPITAHAV
ncbi:protein Wiz-like isoform X2 [Scleropages formosus]|uniref:protein Wiz-like isoform X2 n=1 Tax=Scleropages formosus TaxID=113540 RepID=UPI0010FA9FE9|nr:protein Wiz-like isoform X2 [Scleropages formosus]